MVRWFLLFAIVLSTAQIWAYGLERPESPETNQSTKPEPNEGTNELQTYAQSSVVPSDLNLPTSTDYNRANDGNKDTTEEANALPMLFARKDLKAQRSMAKSARRTLYVAYAQLIGSTIGIGILIWTLRSTRKATIILPVFWTSG